MKASEARELSKVSAKTEIAEIMRKINDAAKSGLVKISIVTISGGAIALLKDEGYTCEHIDIGFGRIITYIKW